MLERHAEQLGPAVHVVEVVARLGGAKRRHRPVAGADPAEHATEEHWLPDELDPGRAGDVRCTPRREVGIRARKVEPQLEHGRERYPHVCALGAMRSATRVTQRTFLMSCAARLARVRNGQVGRRLQRRAPELGRRTFLVPENHSEVLALLYHEQTGIVGGLPVGPVTTDPFGAHGIRMYPDQDPVVLEETRRYFEKLAERFSNDLPKA